MNPFSSPAPLGDSDSDADTPHDLTAPASRDLPQRLLELLARDPRVVWTPAGLVAASGARPDVVAGAIRALVGAGRALDLAPKGTEPRLRDAGGQLGAASADGAPVEDRVASSDLSRPEALVDPLLAPDRCANAAPVAGAGND